jgi:hypothetical protein
VKKAAAATNSSCYYFNKLYVQKKLCWLDYHIKRYEQVGSDLHPNITFCKINSVFKVKGGSLIHYSNSSKNHHKIYVRIGDHILYDGNEE